MPDSKPPILLPRASVKGWLLPVKDMPRAGQIKCERMVKSNANDWSSGVQFSRSGAVCDVLVSRYDDMWALISRLIVVGCRCTRVGKR